MPLRKVRSEILGTRRLVHSRAYEYGKHRIRSFSFPAKKPPLRSALMCGLSALRSLKGNFLPVKSEGG